MENNLNQYIEAIRAKTEVGEIKWQKQSPVVFVALITSGGNKAQIILQRVASRAGADYVLRVIDEITKLEVVNVSGSTKPQLAPILRQLFAAADNNVDAFGAQFLKNLLGPQ